jgi:hypothetical protein
MGATRVWADENPSHAFGGDPRRRPADCQEIITNHDLPPPRLPA